MIVINFPAAEEARTWGEYAKLFFARNPHAKKEDLMLMNPEAKITRKQYFDWCWQQPEAEEIHAIYKR